MKRLRHMIRLEMDVEFFACTHGVSLIFIYGFLRWLDGIGTVDFGMILEMMILGYVISWMQKLLFLKEKTYSRREYRIRSILWSALAILFMIIFGELFSWFGDNAGWVRYWFYGIMSVYFVMVWFFIENFYKKDTEEMNRLLAEYKRKR